MLKQLFTREWVVTTFIVLAGAALCVRLGFWQLDRLEQRKAFNAHVEAMWAADPVELDSNSTGLTEMEYRSALVSGEFDYENQFALRNQYWNDRYGYHLVTPLIIDQDTAILVDRGWIPAEGNENPESWRAYDDKVEVDLSGIIRLGQEKPDVGGRPDPTLAPNQIRLDLWNNVNISRIEKQVPYDLLDVYVQLDEDEYDNDPPIPYQPEIEISEGPHLGYAGQWFTFAALLVIGYPFFVSRRSKK